MKLYNIYENDSLVLGSIKFGEIKAYFGKQVNPSKYIGTDKLYLGRYRINVAIERESKRKRIDGKNNIPFDLVAEWEKMRRCARDVRDGKAVIVTDSKGRKYIIGRTI